MVTEKLDVIGAWSDEEEKLVQVIYEDRGDGTLYISRTRGHPRNSVTVVSTDGLVHTISDARLEELRGING